MSLVGQEFYNSTGDRCTINREYNRAVDGLPMYEGTTHKSDGEFTWIITASSYRHNVSEGRYKPIPRKVEPECIEI